jgi:hypothetical protein
MSLDDAIGATNASGENPVPNNPSKSRNIYNADNNVLSKAPPAMSNTPPKFSNTPALTVDNSFASSADTRRHLPYQVR